MILSNLAKIIPWTMTNQSRPLPATYGGDYTLDGKYLFNIEQTGANGSIKRRMQNYNTNSDPHNTSITNSALNTLICVGSGTTPPR